MPMVHPFSAVRYATGTLDRLAAPPYDVLSAQDKAALLSHDPRNIVRIDLPHVPPKNLGPASAYQEAGDTYARWLSDGTLHRESQPAIYLYRQRYLSARGETIDRCGVCCCIDVVPFGRREGGGVLPHEETFSGPKEDRMALMRATRAQLSPIFGLHADEQGLASQLTRDAMSRFEPDARADMGDGVLHEAWTVTDGVIIRAFQDALRGEEVFIADGHHRYTTQLNYLNELEAELGPLEDSHPARRCMVVLVSMNDPGLEIRPTHRVVGGMRSYSFEAFVRHAGSSFRVKPLQGGLEAVSRVLTTDLGIGVYDFKTRAAAMLVPLNPELPPTVVGDRSSAWRRLDVAWVQHVLIQQICRSALNDGEDVRWAFPHTIEEIVALGRGAETGTLGSTGAQLALVLRPTPLHAVREICQAGELMPQKSTFFFPKLATGLWINPFA